MQQKTRAQRGLRRASENVVLAIDISEDTPALALRQDLLCRRFGLLPATAALLAELAFATTDRWGRA